MSSDKKKTILTIKNTIDKMDLLRVHIYEYSVRFDKNVEKAINNNSELRADVEELNFLWKNQEITEHDILKIILYLMSKYGFYLKDYYFKKEDLDENGCYVDNDYSNRSEVLLSDDERLFFYQYFKDQKALKKISKKKFETELPEDHVDEYVQKYVFKGARFYSGILEEEKFKSVWYFMVVDTNVILAFEKIEK